MTRLALLADLHGNLPALEAVIAHMADRAIDHVIVAGDLINFGPYSVEVVERVLDLRWSLLRGNHEYYMLDIDTPRAPAHWHDYGMPYWLRAIIPPDLQRIIAGLPDALTLRLPDAPLLQVVHGSPGDPWRGIYTITPDETIADMLYSVAADYIAVAHTHLVMERQSGRWRIFNSGSVGLPLDGLPGACYAILEGDAQGWRAEFHRVPYDTAPIFEQFERIGFDASVDKMARLVIEEFRTFRPNVYCFRQWCIRHAPDAPFSDALVDAYLVAPDRWNFLKPHYYLNFDSDRVPGD